MGEAEMKLFLAGNFPLMSNIEKEREMKDYVFSKDAPYNRLASFFYTKGAANLVEIRSEVLEETK